MLLLQSNKLLLETFERRRTLLSFEDPVRLGFAIQGLHGTRKAIPEHFKVIYDQKGLLHLPKGIVLLLKHAGTSQLVLVTKQNDDQEIQELHLGPPGTKSSFDIEGPR